MWVLTSFGAFMPAMRPAKTIAEGDDKVLQIRARRRIDLKRLKQHYMPELGPVYVVKGADYQFRANASRADWAAALVKIAGDIDYVSFKDTTVSVWRDDQLHTAYMRVWNALYTSLSPRPKPAKPTKRQARERRNWWEDIAAENIPDAP